MIGIRLQGRLGNQMFQYATARTLAERLGCGLYVAGNTPTARFGVLGRLAGLDRRPPYIDMRQNGELHAAFGCGPSFVGSRLNELALPIVRPREFPRVFRPRTFEVGSDSFEEFDSEIFRQGPGTWLDGLFQSPGYFSEAAEEVRRWFSPAVRVRRQVDSIAAQWPKAPSEMVAVHVRRGDYVQSGGAIASASQGWALPMSYYDDALALLPKGVGLALFSDDADWAETHFKRWGPWVSRKQPSVVDMMAMARCRRLIIANSSFSWWAGWLNPDPDKVVFAPEHHLGFRVGRWVPGGIEVPGWRYLSAKAS